MTNLFNFLDPGEYEDFLPLVLQPQLLALAQYKLGDGFQIAGPDVVIRDPGVAQHALHADVPLGWFAQQGLPIPRNICFGLQLIWLLTDFTRENGATALVPVSHLLDPPNKWPNDDGEMMYYNDEVRRLRQEIEEGDPHCRLHHLEGKAGSVVAYHMAMWHRAGGNSTPDERRVAAIAPYFARWVEPGYGLNLRGGLLKRKVRDRMPEAYRKMCLHVAEDYPDVEELG